MMKIDTSSDSNDIFGCVRYGSNGFGTNKARPSMISAKYRLKEERRKVLKISIGKLKRIEDPESSLCRSVLINNTMKRLQREAREEKLQRQGIYPTTTTQQTVVSFERTSNNNNNDMDEHHIKPNVIPMVSIEPVPSVVTLSVTNPITSSSPITVPPSCVTVTSTTTTSPVVTPTITTSSTVTSSNSSSESTTTTSRKRSTTADVECDECDVQDVLSHFYMPPTPRLLTSIDDEDEIIPPKRQRLHESNTMENNNNTSLLQLPSNIHEQQQNLEELPSIIDSQNNSSSSSIIFSGQQEEQESPSNNKDSTEERLQSELLCTDALTKDEDAASKSTLLCRTADNETDEVDVVNTLDVVVDLPAIHERLTSPSMESTTTTNDNNNEIEEDEEIDVVNETSSLFDDDFNRTTCSRDQIVRMDVSEVLSTNNNNNRLRDFCTLDDSTSRFQTSLSLGHHERRCNSLNLSSSSSSPQSNGVVMVPTPIVSNNTNTTSSSSMTTSLDTNNEQQHFSCGHSSIFGELQSVVFHSLITSLES